MTTCYQPYIICSTPRTGSTLLCKLLAATSKSGKPDSHFHSHSVVDWIRNFNLSPDKLSNEQDLLAAIFQAVRDQGDGGTGMFGLRIQRQSFDYFIQ